MQTEEIRYYKIADICYKVTLKNADGFADDKLLDEYRSGNEETMNSIDVFVTRNLPEPVGEQVFSDNHKVIYISKDGSQMRFEGVLAKDVGSAYMCICRKEKLSIVHVKPEAFSGKTLLKAMELEHFTADTEGVLFHAAFVEVDGKALLFTAPSGVGKSTQADLWCREKGAELINGDRCVLKVKDGRVFALGVPYCGSSGVRKNRTIEVAAVIYLGRAETPSVRRLSGVTAFLKIFEGICVNTWNSSDMENSLKTVTAIAENVPIFMLMCTPDILSVRELEKALKEMRTTDEQ